MFTYYKDMKGNDGLGS